MATETAQQRQDRENYESAQAWQRERNAYLLTLAPTVEQGEAIAQANAASAAAWQRERDAFLASQAAPAAAAYTQQYIPGNYTPELVDYLGNPLATKYGDPIYSVATDRVPRTLIGRVGMTPIVTPAMNERGAPTITFSDDPAYQKSQQQTAFEQQVASGAVESSGLYGPALDGGRERRDFVERESAYTSYDPATNIVKFYDLEGNVTQEGQRTSGNVFGGGLLGNTLSSLSSGFNQTAANPDFQKAVMLAALATAGGAAFGTTGLPLGLDALPATGAGTTAGTTAGSVLAPGSYSLAGSAASSAAPILGAQGAGAAFTAAELAAAQSALGGTSLFASAAPSVLAPGSYSLAGAGGALGTAGGTSAGLFSNLGSAASNLLPNAPSLSSAASNILPNASVLAPDSYSLTGTGGILGTAGNVASSLLPGASSLSSFLPSLLTGGLQTLGAANTAEKAREAAQIQAAAQVEAARIAADAAKFRPVGVTTRFGASNFQTDAQGNVIGAGYTASPEIQAYQNRLSALAAQGLTGAEGAQAAYAPLTTGAQSLFNLGQGYIQQTPEQQAAAYIAKQQALLDPMQQQQLAQLQAKLFAQGRGGVSVAQGGDLAATSPELAAYYNSLAQTNLQLAAAGQQAGMEQARFGAGLLGTGSDLMGKYYGGQTAAYAPFATAIDTSSSLEGLAQIPLTLGMNIGGVTTAASTQAGKLLSQGMIDSAGLQAKPNAFSYSGNLFSQAANNPELQDYLRRAFAT